MTLGPIKVECSTFYKEIKMHLFPVDVLGLGVDEGAVRAQMRGYEVDLEVWPGLVVEAGLAEEHGLEAGGGGQGAGAVLEVVAPMVRGEDVAHVVVSERPVRDEEGRLARPHVALHAVAHGQVRLHGYPQLLRRVVWMMRRTLKRDVVSTLLPKKVSPRLR